MRNRRLSLAAVAATMLAGACAPQAANSDATAADSKAVVTRKPEAGVKIRIVAAGRSLIATLDDNAASSDFAALLPVELTLRDYHGTEKIADLPARLSTADAPRGIDPSIGDIAYYAPWGNLALFYRDFGYSEGLIRLGRIEGDLGALAGSDRVRVTIERAEK